MASGRHLPLTLVLVLLQLQWLSTINGRETLEIGIGIGIGGGSKPPSEGGGCPPPPPPPTHPPPPPPPTPRPPPPPPSPRPPPPPPSPRPPPPPPSPRPKPPPPTPRPLPPRLPPSPRPPQFENEKLRNAYKVIQAFKRTITRDPKGITKTWDAKNFDPCSYKGFYCDRAPDDKKKQRTIASIDFNRYGFSAPKIQGLPDLLPDLALFHANSNNFSGTVPDLRHLRYFYELDVSNNKLVGAFPTTVLPLANLTFLDLRFNKFVGTVPPSVFFIALDVLFLNNNNFSQPIPATLGSTTALYLVLANNRFTGPIPRSIGNTSNTLLEVLFLNNSLSGCLPYEIGLLKKATVFDAGFNQITGPLPLSLGCLRKVEQLNFAVNLLYGDIPDVVCRLPNIQNLSLSNNYFTSIGPSCWMLLKKGILDIRKNCIPGCPNQRPSWECARFFFRRPRICPLLTYIPCSIGKEENIDVGAGMLPPAEPSKSTYTTYSALAEPPPEL